MANACSICGKKKGRGNFRQLLRGHYNITGKRDFKPNLQKTVHQGQRVLACTKCIRTQLKATKGQT
ncbi:MAG: 50S ribosomal protein L28 [Candidatus Andersenbacteria bacterium CG10_big_fil_rev_8_21_14_0_10_54_11]|uniref:50S ribosomal protein L28 n=1 Tax=Candidatus Andersenbacteria bacterium CG10_big_fil_rev_8_21_14_0_10_54_11 TaxID=1974485 RepID=A0A2M6WYU4_9BACT|nr:MAG: 50S ribosomal protein L28 [Candidatus Andersenbacteria bacterium CG10_big_fil_rev_8_21_14_0_10_54_11]